MRVILVGRAPSRSSDPSRPFQGTASGRHLLKLSGLQPEQFWKAFEARNLLDYWPGPAGRQGDRLPAREARSAALELRPQLLGRRVLLLGPDVAQAFGLEREPLRWTVGQGLEAFWAIFPHPSRVSRWWNLEENELAAAAFLRAAALPQVGEGGHPPLFPWA